jgi:hypothetical protein
MVWRLQFITGYNKEDGPEGAENRDDEYLAFELPEFYLRSLKRVH